MADEPDPLRSIE
jgi:hypothetical protein